MLTKDVSLEIANRIGRAMADPTRSKILLELLQQACYPSQIAKTLDLTRTNVSNHLSCLRGCGIVVAIAQGRNTKYQIASPKLADAIASLIDTLAQVDAQYSDRQVCEYCNHG